MSQPVPLRVVSPLLTLNGDKSKLVEIPAGSTIDTLVDISKTDALVEPGFHTVRYERSRTAGVHQAHSRKN